MRQRLHPTPRPITRGRVRPPGLKLVLAAVSIAVSSACSPIYVIRAGIAEARILAARRPLTEVVLDPATDERTRGKLVLVIEARAWAQDSLGLDVGDAYTSYTQLESDTLALVLSAAYKDRLASKTWWFPIVGHVPYRGFFDEEQAQEEELELQAEGFDTYLRPTGAFSTLGWFADPLLSSIVREDEVDLIETVLHELSHNHLFVPGQVRFNESFATFVGRVGAIDFFCKRPGGGADTVWCDRARARWRDFQRFSAWLDPLVADLQALYGDAAISHEQKLVEREVIAARHRERFKAEIQPAMESYRSWGFVDRPLNNATLLGQMLYYHRLADFQALLDAHGGDVSEAVAALAARAGDVDDPFQLLPRALEAGQARP
jgi:predicted aminopeptidase